MKMSGFMFLGIGILLFAVGIFLTVGVIVSGIPLLGWFAWIPMAIGGIMIIVGIVLLIIRR